MTCWVQSVIFFVFFWILISIDNYILHLPWQSLEMVRSTLSRSFRFFSWRERKLFQTLEIECIFLLSFSIFSISQRWSKFVTRVGIKQALFTLHFDTQTFKIYLKSPWRVTNKFFFFIIFWKIIVFLEFFKFLKDFSRSWNNLGVRIIRSVIQPTFWQTQTLKIT